jgi:[acyl-carrier-protein] S-malonyltransferase
VRLNVSGPFHSSLMKPAAERMASVIEKAAIRDAAIPVFTNCDAAPTTAKDEIKKKLVEQIDHAVLWEDSMRRMIQDVSPDLFVEVGAGRVLCGLLRRIDKTKKFGNVEDKKSADALLAQA